MTESELENGNDKMVFIIIGRAFQQKGDEPFGIHIMLTAPDDDSAVREALNALAQEGYEEAELDQIGVMEGMPDEEPHASAYQGAMEGEVAIITL
ncbi:MAG: transcriptional regulator [Rhizobiaceae bacterium]|nr:transcriptional regulator [Rhizobiaceae bacterium]MDF2374537.1 transcriptional regulator [Rhizobiaceae bacterium]|tara:strand:- start:71 stop:355 length:285 start_codon:yes stop_codon:yes gene_type:complete